LNANPLPESPPPPKDRLDAFFRKARRAVSGYDIILGASELSCTAEWFVAECRRRMAAAGDIAGRVPDVSDASRAAA
jgi:hypothetical protein